jgi:hypothetical protein
MKKTILCATAILLLFSSCSKSFEAITEIQNTKTGTSAFTQYIIKSGEHYANINPYKKVSTGEMNFVVKFDSTAIYQSGLQENQYDINKLCGFADNNSYHHQYSARFGWRWSDDSLRLFAYVYNNGAVQSKELTTIPIGKEMNCSIKVDGNQYIFTVNDTQEKLPRESTTAVAEGYQLYPYFGGDETAPHDIYIWIK